MREREQAVIAEMLKVATTAADSDPWLAIERLGDWRAQWVAARKLVRATRHNTPTAMRVMAALAKHIVGFSIEEATKEKL